MAPSYRTDRVTTRHDLRDNPRLVLMAPLPPATGSGENLQPPNRLRDSNMFSVHSKPNGQNQTADSQISTSPGRWPQNTAYEFSDVVRIYPNPPKTFSSHRIPKIATESLLEAER